MENDLADLAWALESDGIGRHEVSVRQVVRWARAAGVSSVAVDILADPREPEVARLRAFGQVAGALALSGHQVHDLAA
jgi:hypothetical protein